MRLASYRAAPPTQQVEGTGMHPLYSIRVPKVAGRQAPLPTSPWESVTAVYSDTALASFQA